MFRIGSIGVGQYRFLLAATAWAGLGLSSPCWAQQDAEASPASADRETLYDEVAAESVHLQRQANVLRKVVQLAKPTVVHIDAEHESADRYPRRSVEEAGSGTVIRHRDKFYVLTNRHVVKGATPQGVRIKLADGRVINPQRIWADPPTDIAVLPVDANDLTPARVGDSDELGIGDFVLAVGSPFGLNHSVTFGIVSAKGRRKLELGENVRFKDFIQTDAAINPGNSGGPLLNLKGEVIGMNTAIASSSGGNEGIGFTIPINMVMIVAKQLIENEGRVARAFMGVNLDSKFTPVAASRLGLQRPRGARISGITPESPAQLAGLQVDDVVLEFDGVPVEDDDHLFNLVGLTEVNKVVPVVVLRNRDTFRVDIKVGSRDTFQP